jgi:hypothetical protein
MSEFLQYSESEGGEVIPPPVNTEEAITVVRALEAPGTGEFLSQRFAPEDVESTQSNVYAWYRHHMNDGLPNLRPGGPGAIERNGTGPDLDATLLSGAEELVDGSWTEGPRPAEFTPTQAGVVMAALRRAVQVGRRSQPQTYESLRTADYLAKRAPGVRERVQMTLLVRAAMPDVILAA